MVLLARHARAFAIRSRINSAFLWLEDTMSTAKSSVKRRPLSPNFLKLTPRGNRVRHKLSPRNTPSSPSSSRDDHKTRKLARNEAAFEDCSTRIDVQLLQDAMYTDMRQSRLTGVGRSCPQKDQAFYEQFGALLNVLLVTSRGDAMRAHLFLTELQEHVYSSGSESQCGLKYTNDTMVPERCRQNTPRLSGYGCAPGFPHGGQPRNDVDCEMRFLALSMPITLPLLALCV